MHPLHQKRSQNRDMRQNLHCDVVVCDVCRPTVQVSDGPEGAPSWYASRCPIPAPVAPSSAGPEKGAGRDA